MANFFKFKYMVLILSVVFLVLGINSFKNQVFEIGLQPYTNITADRMTGEEKFILHVDQPATVLLLHKAIIGSGYAEFKLTRDSGEVVEQYKFSGDDFINKEINLDQGNYICTINRNVTADRESFRFYFDKRLITQEYVKRDSNIKNFN